MTEQEKKYILQGMLIHFLYSFCLANNLPMNVFNKGKEDLKDRLKNLYKNMEKFNND